MPYCGITDAKKALVTRRCSVEVRSARILLWVVHPSLDDVEKGAMQKRVRCK